MPFSRRSFLGAMLAACAAPAIVRASSLMKVVTVSEVPPVGLEATESGILVPKVAPLLRGEIGTIEGFSFIEASDSRDLIRYSWELRDDNGKTFQRGETGETTVTIKGLTPGGQFRFHASVRAENVDSISRVNPDLELASKPIFLHRSPFGDLQSSPEGKRKKRENPARKSAPIKYGPANRRKYG